MNVLRPQVLQIVDACIDNLDGQDALTVAAKVVPLVKFALNPKQAEFHILAGPGKWSVRAASNPETPSVCGHTAPLNDFWTTVHCRDGTLALHDASISVVRLVFSRIISLHSACIGVFLGTCVYRNGAREELCPSWRSGFSQSICRFNHAFRISMSCVCRSFVAPDFFLLFFSFYFFLNQMKSPN